MVLSTAIWYYENVMTTLTVKIPEALDRSIAMAARRERVTKSELVRRAMAKYVAQTGEDHKFQSALDLAGGLIGSVRGGPVDLATNAKYMDDYGKGHGRSFCWIQVRWWPHSVVTTMLMPGRNHNSPHFRRPF